MTYYDVLGVPFHASDEEIKRAYRAQIKFFHPDVFPENPEIAQLKTLQLNEAYEVLKNPQKRRAYDLTIRNDRQSAPPPPPSSSPHQSTAQYKPSQKPTDSSKERYKFNPVERAKFIILTIFVAFILIYVMLDASSSPTPPYSTPTVFPSSTLPPIHINMKSGTVILSPKDDALAPLTVETPYGQNYYICLKSRLGNKDSEMSFYVKGGETESVQVPLGKYDIYYAKGDSWFGTKFLFGDDTSYYKLDDVFDFYIDDDAYMGWTLTLSTVYNGNLNSDLLTADDFPTIG